MWVEVWQISTDWMLHFFNKALKNYGNYMYKNEIHWKRMNILCGYISFCHQMIRNIEKQILFVLFCLTK